MAPQTGGGMAWKSPWLVKVLETYGGRLATETTMEPPATKSRNEEVRIPDERRVSIGRGMGPRGVPHR